MNKLLWPTTLVLVGMLAGCGGNRSYVKGGEIRKTIDQEAIKGKYIETIGIGAADSTLTNTTRSTPSTITSI